MRIRKISKIETHSLIMTSFFFLCFIPLWFGSLSINYSFVLLPGLALISNKLAKPPMIIAYALVFYLIVYLIANIWFLDQASSFFRRTSSFFIFMSLYVFAFIPITEQMIKSFKLALILIATYYSLDSLLEFLSIDLLDTTNIKDGKQRYGFIYIMAIFLLLYNFLQSPKIKEKSLYFLFILIIFVGLMLTISRAAVLSLFLTIFFYLVFHLHKIRKLKLKNIIIAFLALLIMVSATYLNFRTSINYYVLSLIIPILSGDIINQASNFGSSEGIRIYRLLEIFEYISQHPILGTGFLGIWSISDTGSGSAHNQYGDVLLRVGVIGFAFFIIHITLLTMYLKKHHQDIFWGFFGVLVYGFFHETFKESQGAFVLAFLIGIYAQSLRDRQHFNARRLATI